MRLADGLGFPSNPSKTRLTPKNGSPTMKHIRRILINNITKLCIQSIQHRGTVLLNTEGRFFCVIYFKIRTQRDGSFVLRATNHICTYMVS